MKNKERSQDQGVVRSRGVATTVLMVATFMDLMDSTITNVALPTIGKNLGATPEQLEWTVAGYVIAFATLLITGGRLGDIFGHRRIFVIGIVGFTLASLGAALSQTGDLLVAARVLQGGFAGIMMPQVLSSVQVMFAPEERAPVLGIIGSLSALGAVGGLILGGWLVTADLLGMGWRSIFLVNVPIGVVLVVAALLFVPRSRSEHPLRPDLVGVLLGGLGVFLVVFPLTDGRAAGWAWWIWAMLITSPFVIAAFVWQQGRMLKAHKAPLLPLPLFRDRGFASGQLVQVLSSIGNGGYVLILLYYVQSALGFTALAAGLTLLPFALGSMAAAPLAILATKRIGKWAVLLGGLVQAAALTWVMWTIWTAGAALTGWDVTAPLTLVGAGMMTLIMPLTSITLESVPTPDAGAASGTLTTFGQIGMVLGVALAGSVFFGILQDTADARDAVTTALWVPIVAYGLAGLASVTMPDRTKALPQDA
ncbi:MFS transporter [Corynebacterium durum]|uniref:MFS transporter n=1 Tax=Corynebacterium durum TaxID=61592 RepID=UPI0028E5BCA0|nr:MFS transporter [Corynebacterium durum]